VVCSKVVTICFFPSIVQSLSTLVAGAVIGLAIIWKLGLVGIGVSFFSVELVGPSYSFGVFLLSLHALPGVRRLHPTRKYPLASVR
jgi:hypothetical protein